MRPDSAMRIMSIPRRSSTSTRTAIRLTQKAIRFRLTKKPGTLQRLKTAQRKRTAQRRKRMRLPLMSLRMKSLQVKSPRERNPLIEYLPERPIRREPPVMPAMKESRPAGCDFNEQIRYLLRKRVWQRKFRCGLASDADKVKRRGTLSGLFTRRTGAFAWT